MQPKHRFYMGMVIMGKVKEAIKKVLKKGGGSKKKRSVKDLPLPEEIIDTGVVQKKAVGEHGGAPVTSYVGDADAWLKLLKHGLGPKEHGNESFTSPSYADPKRVPTEEELERMGQAFGGVLLPSLPRIVTRSHSMMG
jgi:hypothetical protein